MLSWKSEVEKGLVIGGCGANRNSKIQIPNHKQIPSSKRRMQGSFRLIRRIEMRIHAGLMVGFENIGRLIFGAYWKKSGQILLLHGRGCVPRPPGQVLKG